MAKTKQTSKRTSSTLPRGNRLVALSVSGDAFLLVRNDDNLLVDGGGSGKKLYTQLQSELPEPLTLRRIICTHNDADHAKGLAQLLGDRRRFDVMVDEVWLPGSWAMPGAIMAAGHVRVLVGSVFNRYLADLLKAKPKSDSMKPQRGEVLSQMLIEILKIDDLAERASIEPPQVTDEIQLQERREHPGEFSVDDLNEILRRRDVRTVIKEITKESRKYQNHLRSVGKGLGCSKRLIEGIITKFLGVVSCLENIAEISFSAKHRGAKIRWFDAEQYYKNIPAVALGGDFDLAPLNSVELKFLNPIQIDIMEILTLTRVNKHSLVFWAIESPDIAGCIFSADGLLDGDVLDPPPVRPVAVTAPHHGSETNKSAYSNITRMLQGNLWRNNSILMRSDVQNSKNPCAEFKTAAKRLCTTCPQSQKKPRKQILFTDVSGNWDFVTASAASACSC